MKDNNASKKPTKIQYIFAYKGEIPFAQGFP
jgi:hypothetical protein